MAGDYPKLSDLIALQAKRDDAIFYMIALVLIGVGVLVNVRWGQARWMPLARFVVVMGYFALTLLFAVMIK